MQLYRFCGFIMLIILNKNMDPKSSRNPKCQWKQADHHYQQGDDIGSNCPPVKIMHY